MTRLKWGEGPRLYEQGVDLGVLYLDDTAVPWNGLVSVEERDTGTIDEEHYFEGHRIHISEETGSFEGTISAYTYPDVFGEYNGYSDRETYKRFGFSYRTQYAEGYKLHLVYNVLVRNDTRSWSTAGQAPNPSLFQWNIFAASKQIPGASPSAHLVMEAPRNSAVFDALEDILYGTEITEPRLPEPAEVIDLYEEATRLTIIYNGDGTYTATGPDEMVRTLDDGRFEIDAPTVYFIDKDIFVVNSY